MVSYAAEWRRGVAGRGGMTMATSSSIREEPSDAARAPCCALEESGYGVNEMTGARK